MTRHDVRIETAAGRGTVHVDGHDISSAVTSVAYDARAGALVEVHLFVHTSQVAGREVIVHIPDDTAAALQVLGWTPPAADPAGEP